MKDSEFKIVGRRKDGEWSVTISFRGQTETFVSSNMAEVFARVYGWLWSVGYGLPR